MECTHQSTSKKMVKIDYFGLTFSAKMDVCDKCEAYLWTEESKVKLNQWMSEQKRQHRDSFIVQTSITVQAKQCLDEIIRDYPTIQISALIRAMTVVFLEFMKRPEASAIFEDVAAGEHYSLLSVGEKDVAKVQFNATGMLDLESWSKILDMTNAKIVEEAVYRITSLHIENDPKLKEFWNSQILPQLTMILKSAA